MANLSLTDSEMYGVRQFAINAALSSVNRLGDVVSQDQVIVFATAIEDYIVRPPTAAPAA